MWNKFWKKAPKIPRRPMLWKECYLPKNIFLAWKASLLSEQWRNSCVPLCKMLFCQKFSIVQFQALSFLLKPGLASKTDSTVTSGAQEEGALYSFLLLTIEQCSMLNTYVLLLRYTLLRFIPNQHFVAIYALLMCIIITT